MVFKVEFAHPTRRSFKLARIFFKIFLNLVKMFANKGHTGYGHTRHTVGCAALLLDLFTGRAAAAVAVPERVNNAVVKFFFVITVPGAVYLVGACVCAVGCARPRLLTIRTALCR